MKLPNRIGKVIVIMYTKTEIFVFFTQKSSVFRFSMLRWGF